MSTALSWPLGLILIAALIGVAGSLRRAGLSPTRKALLCLLQGVAAITLWLALFPPQSPLPAVSAHLLTSPVTQLPANTHGPFYALPEAGTVAGVQRVADLASLLRAQPQITAVQLHGDGLPARDRLPQRAALAYVPAPLHGLVEVQLPGAIAAGGQLQLHARVAGRADAAWQAELRDPAERLVDRQAVSDSGQVRLQAPLRDAGLVVYTLRIVDADNHLVDSAPLPVQVMAGHALRLHQLAGAPNAENKFTQRWAVDASLRSTRQLPTGGGMLLGDVGAGIDARQLANSDLLLLDERSLLALGSGGRARVRSALGEGLGVLVQPADALQASHRQALAELGLRVDGGNRTQPLQLEADKATPERLDVLRGPRAHSPAQPEALPALARWNVSARDAQPLQQGSHHLGLWQAVGKGRIGLLSVPDTHLLVLAGRDELHASLWAGISSTLARPQASNTTAQQQTDGEHADDERAGGKPTGDQHPRSDHARLQHPAVIWQGERTTVCGLPADTHITHSDSQQDQHLRIDPATPGCAAWWPEHSGWHRIGDQALYVTAPAQAPGLHRAHTQRETAVVVAASALPADHAPPQQPGPRWPWWLALVGLLGVLWWVERKNGI